LKRAGEHHRLSATPTFVDLDLDLDLGDTSSPEIATARKRFGSILLAFEGTKGRRKDQAASVTVGYPTFCQFR